MVGYLQGILIFYNFNEITNIFTKIDCSIPTNKLQTLLKQ